MIEKAVFERLGFKQIPGAPEGAISNGTLKYWPDYNTSHWPGTFELDNPHSGLRGIPPELQPQTNSDLLRIHLLLRSVKLAKETEDDRRPA